MAIVALVGPDGAGKTTLTRLLVQSGIRSRYLYMGINAGASNIALPTTRLATRLARPSRRGTVRALAGLVNRLADAWFRQLAAWYYEARGYLVVCDRHFALDFAPELALNGNDSMTRRLQIWSMSRFYPKPDMVIYLDAPADVLYARKGELNVPELDRRRRAFLAQARRVPRFVVVDATAPIETVYERIVYHVNQLSPTRN